MSDISYHVVDALRDARKLMVSMGQMCYQVANFLASSGFDDLVKEATLRLRQENQKRISEVNDALRAEQKAREDAEMQREIDEIEDRT